MLVTVNEAKEVLGIEGQDDLLESLIKRASASIESYCRREFDAQDITEEFKGTGSKEYVPAQYPINSISKLSVRTGLIGQDSWREISSNLYNHNGNVVMYSGTFSDKPRMYKLEYNAGYSTIPDDIKQATIDLVGFFYITRQGRGIKSEKIGDYSVTFADFTDAIEAIGVRTLLDTYINYRQ